MEFFGIVSYFMKKVFANEINSVNKIWGRRAARGERLFKHTSKHTLLQHLSHTICMHNDGANYRWPRLFNKLAWLCYILVITQQSGFPGSLLTKDNNNSNNSACHFFDLLLCARHPAGHLIVFILLNLHNSSVPLRFLSPVYGG